MMFTFVSSFNIKLYQEYARNFLRSWHEYADPSINLYIFFEGAGIEEVQKEFSSNNIHILHIQSALLSDFHIKFGRFKEANGIQFNISANDQVRLGYNYRFDAIRFSFKAFALYRAVAELNICGKIAWIDSDIVCRKFFNGNDLNEIFPLTNQIASFLGRDNFPKPNAYSECGFVGYNLDNSSSKEFLMEFINIYTTGDIFKLKEWHDCMAFDSLRLKYQSRGARFLNLSGDFAANDHPFMLSKLGIYFDHLKGPERKKRGSSY